MATLTQLLRKYDNAPVEQIRALAKQMREEDGVEPSLANRLAVEELLDGILAEAKKFWDYVESQGGSRPRRAPQEVVREQFARFKVDG